MWSLLGGGGLAVLGLAAGVIGWLWTRAQLEKVRGALAVEKVQRQIVDAARLIAESDLDRERLIRHSDMERFESVITDLKKATRQAEEDRNALVAAIGNDPRAVAVLRDVARRRLSPPLPTAITPTPTGKGPRLVPPPESTEGDPTGGDRGK